MPITWYTVFEELRYMGELLTAELIFTLPSAKRREHFLLKLIVGFVVCMAATMGYLLLRISFDHISALAISTLNVVWYALLVILSLFYIRLCFDITVADTLFRGIAGFASQHIVYVLFNEVLALGLFPQLRETPFLYMSLCVLSCAAIYVAIYFLFARRFRKFAGIAIENNVNNILFYGLILSILFAASFFNQYVFRFMGDTLLSTPNYFAAAADAVNCVFILVVQQNLFKMNRYYKENGIIEQLLYENKRQYELSKENIDVINRKCHDLKYQISALRTGEDKGILRENAIAEMEKAVMIYDAAVKTDNEVLNTILTEKSLYCESRKIRLSCVIDSGGLDFMDTIDIYTLVGNALDNAVECVEKHADPEKRVISLTISRRNKFLCIQVSNYYENAILMKDGLPVTSKSDAFQHGYGVKSIKMLVEKYGGALQIDTASNIFTLQTVIPLPS